MMFIHRSRTALCPVLTRTTCKFSGTRPSMPVHRSCSHRLTPRHNSSKMTRLSSYLGGSVWSRSTRKPLSMWSRTITTMCPRQPRRQAHPETQVRRAQATQHQHHHSHVAVTWQRALRARRARRGESQTGRTATRICTSGARNWLCMYVDGCHVV